MKITDIVSSRLILRHLDADFLESCLSGDIDAAIESLGARPADGWLEETALMAVRLADMAAEPDYAPWSARALLRRDDLAMVGHINFHTLPGHPYLNGYGDVELGYTVYPAFRRQGFAREALLAMAGWAAAQGGVSRLVLSIAPDNLPSQALAAQLGFAKAGQVRDDDGCEDVLTAIWPLPGAAV
ncbi:GNAT family N-acetyltransferase [Chromobacterium sp. ATCC 53434]|uniref:GNAT family N-acetyltransferase n=1 Tax=Chromobacterium sp. (strain ATCC 53434 / SC 14030) TaxID=2059672 RepID=UPI000C78B1B5|nr:GNAT family protein [Chromobacterium sp. ATCC 53434]AUH50337.1 GNAT family N-acetyltransferase [Chromobacterium sp. ATCC 53434]